MKITITSAVNTANMDYEDVIDYILENWPTKAKPEINADRTYLKLYNKPRIIYYCIDSIIDALDEGRTLRSALRGEPADEIYRDFRMPWVAEEEMEKLDKHYGF